jgi:hypothetical protein
MGECTLGSATSKRIKLEPLWSQPDMRRALVARPCNGACLRGCVAANVVHFLRTGVDLASIDADCGRISSPRRDVYCSALQSRRYGSGMFIASPDYHPHFERDAASNVFVGREALISGCCLSGRPGS